MKKPNYLYFIGTTDHIKIGITSNPDSRLRSLKTSCPIPCDYLAIFECGEKARQFEHKIHEIFAPYRSHGEWFVNHDDILKFIRESKELGCLKYNMWEERYNDAYYVINDKYLQAHSVDISKHIKALHGYNQRINAA